MSQLSKNPGTLGEHHIRIAEDGVREKTSVGEGFYPWRGVQRIMENDRHIFIFFEPNLAAVIPKRAFPGPDDARKFLDTALSHWQGTRT